MQTYVEPPEGANGRTRKHKPLPNNTPAGQFDTNQHSKVFEMIAVFPRNRKRDSGEFFRFAPNDGTAVKNCHTD